MLNDDFGLRVPTVNYPPYNIVETAKNKYDIEVALAGYSKKDIEIKGAELKDGLLKVSLEKIIPETKKPRTIDIK
jgi:molecular chaperone IbpA